MISPFFENSKLKFSKTEEIDIIFEFCNETHQYSSFSFNYSLFSCNNSLNLCIFQLKKNHNIEKCKFEIPASEVVQFSNDSDGNFSFIVAKKICSLLREKKKPLVFFFKSEQKIPHTGDTNSLDMCG